jgi:hypothetical protein
MLALEPQMYPPKSVARPSLENAPQLIPPSKSDEEPGKDVHLVLLSNGLKVNLGTLPGWDKSTKNPLRSYALTLDECALATKHYVTIAEE